MADSLQSVEGDIGFVILLSLLTVVAVALGVVGCFVRRSTGIPLGMVSLFLAGGCVLAGVEA